MGRKGPCFHCGIEYTPLWRNGPPDKPVLCNACGSRWRIWGTLENYTPKHASASMYIRNDIQSSKKGKLPLPIKVHDTRKPKYSKKCKRYSAGFDDDTNNGSGTGSEISSSDDCIQMESINGKKASDLVQASLWNSRIPRRKRSVLDQYILSPIERLHRQLYNILQEPEFSKLSSEQENVLIFHNSQISSAEIGLGCVVHKSTASYKGEDKETHL